MQIRKDTVGLTVDKSLMRLHVVQPQSDGCWPGILFYSDIYQLGAPITRLADRLASYGYLVAAPEIFHRREPIGSAIEPDPSGRLRGNDNAANTSIAAYDSDAAAALAWLAANAEKTEAMRQLRKGLSFMLQRELARGLGAWRDDTGI